MVGKMYMKLSVIYEANKKMCSYINIKVIQISKE